MSKPAHPFKDVTHIPNVFYFLSTNPQRYEAIDYFRTFSDLHTSKKATLHRYWGYVIDILRASSIPKFHNSGNRLSTIWKAPGKGLTDFWKQQEETETAQDDLHATTMMVRKRSYRSVRHHISQAFNAVDNHTVYESSGSKRRHYSVGLLVHAKAFEELEKPEQEELGEKQLDKDKKEREDEEGKEKANKEQNDDDNELEESAFQSDSDECASQCSEGSEYLPGGKKSQAASIYYFTGNGSSDCSKELWTPWVIEGEDLAGKIWEYRMMICQKAKKLEALSGSVEKLAINHIYLFDPKDTSSALYDAIGAAHWAIITSMSLNKLLPSDSISSLVSYAIELSQMSYATAQDCVLDWEGDRDVKKILNHLLADDFLWKDADFNELEMVQHVFDPFLKTFISSIQGGIGRWDKIFLPSQQRKKNAHIETEEKVAFLLKDAIDDMARQRVDVVKLKVFGMVVVGVEGVLYSMQLVARGIYIMKQYAVVYAPRSQFDLFVVAGAINTFLNLREELITTMEVCRKSRLEKPTDLTRPSFGTPIKVNRTGIKEDFSGSPCLRQVVLQTAK
ncbi:hypothetical protein BX616_002074 [Lobosporangium transversale]|nr:hypothetical protein BX616_002074 [Lobosporangium transversale]